MQSIRITIFGAIFGYGTFEVYDDIYAEYYYNTKYECVSDEIKVNVGTCERL